jgi:uncharacterized protein (TIGR02145 family)
MKMKKFVYILFFISFIVLYIFSCEKDIIQEKDTKNKLEFTNINIDSISYRMAVIFFEIKNLDKNKVKRIGICFDTTETPTIEDTIVHLTENISTGAKKLENLSPNTKYYFRLCAILNNSNIYSNEKTFNTLSLGTPIVLTGEITDTTATSAVCEGNVTDSNGSDVTAKGLCWNKTGSPTISDYKTDEGEGLGEFSSNLDNLEINTTYYVRAYATNKIGTAYGIEFSFTTKDGLPELTTNEITDIDSTSATSGGNITDNGGFSVTGRGVCWSTSENPSINDNHTSDGNGTGSFISEITGLTEGTLYYVRAYATNGAGTAYGDEISFYAGFNGTFKDERDNQTYEWVRIGDQIWMGENLNYDQNSYGNDWCYDNNSSNCDTYGRLYDWYAVMQGENSSNSNPSGVQGVCPNGWHVPSDEEWKELEIYLGMNWAEADNSEWRGTNEGSKLAGNADLWNSGDLISNSEFGSSGFTALPGGVRGNNGFDHDGYYGYYWSSYLYDGPWYRYISFVYTNVYRGTSHKEYGYSVRCVRDD